MTLSLAIKNLLGPGTSFACTLDQKHGLHHLAQTDIPRFQQLLLKNPLTELSLRDWNLSDDNIAHLLPELFNKLPALKKLILTGHHVGNHSAVVFSNLFSLQQNLRTIHFGGSRLTDQGLDILTTQLKQSKNLQQIYLVCGDITDAAALRFAMGLAENVSFISGNKMNGFLFTACRENFSVINFVNQFLLRITHRNKKIAAADSLEKRHDIYNDFLNEFQAEVQGDFEKFCRQNQLQNTSLTAQDFLINPNPFPTLEELCLFHIAPATFGYSFFQLASKNESLVEKIPEHGLDSCRYSQ